MPRRFGSDSVNTRGSPRLRPAWGAAAREDTRRALGEGRPAVGHQGMSGHHLYVGTPGRRQISPTASFTSWRLWELPALCSASLLRGRVRQVTSMSTWRDLTVPPLLREADCAARCITRLIRTELMFLPGALLAVQTLVSETSSTVNLRVQFRCLCDLCPDGCTGPPRQSQCGLGQDTGHSPAAQAGALVSRQLTPAPPAVTSSGKVRRRRVRLGRLGPGCHAVFLRLRGTHVHIPTPGTGRQPRGKGLTEPGCTTLCPEALAPQLAPVDIPVHAATGESGPPARGGHGAWHCEASCPSGLSGGVPAEGSSRAGDVTNETVHRAPQAEAAGARAPGPRHVGLSRSPYLERLGVWSPPQAPPGGSLGPWRGRPGQGWAWRPLSLPGFPLADEMDQTPPGRPEYLVSGIRTPPVRRNSKLATLGRIFKPWKWRKKKNEKLKQTTSALEKKMAGRQGREELIKKGLLEMMEQGEYPRAGWDRQGMASAAGSPEVDRAPRAPTQRWCTPRSSLALGLHLSAEPSSAPSHVRGPAAVLPRRRSGPAGRGQMVVISASARCPCCSCVSWE
ncbi:Phosphatase and actin regulator 3 [Galemys pyrenaicus]|uniref:Phosphatase and actin regulator 3 n=1 Tax=Galemys pyrenaicus TaxID=202257 RepID=A0A8J6A9Y9_GALPY|nr:Phosphatase and actin regulator 3 [Galemys pyrenaicus]